MKPTLPTIVSAFAASALAFSAFAEEHTKADDQKPKHDRAADVRPGDRVNDATRATEYIGMTVKNYQNETLGEVDDLAVDVESGRVLQVILSTGGFLGVGDALTAVPPGALHHDVAKKVLHLDANKEKLKAAPRFEKEKWAEYSDINHLSEVYRYYGKESSLTFVHRSDLPPDGARVQDSVPKETVPGTAPTRRADGTLDRSRTEKTSVIPTSRLSDVQKASKVIGMPVKNLQDEKLGKVEDLLVDMAAGRLLAVVVSSGGFLGLGDELSAIPPTSFRFAGARDTLQLDASKDTLSSAPHFKASEWPNFGEPSYVNEVYRAYNADPYHTTDAPADADNTARNVRDRDGRNVTPLDQGNSKADTETTAQIRKEIIATPDMSINAKNVKIVTINGKVTLRGPVSSDEERRLIGEIADRIARAGNVDNQLEVKQSNQSSIN